MGVRAMLTEAGRRAVVAWAFVAGIVTWRRARPDQVEASEKAAKRAWTIRDKMKHMRPEDAVRVLENSAVAKSYAKYLGVNVNELRAHAETLAVFISAKPSCVAPVYVTEADSVADLQRLANFVRVVPVVELHRLIDEESVLAIRRADAAWMLDFTWLARSEHERDRHVQYAKGPLLAIQNMTHDMLRRGVLHPGDERREVEVRLAREDGGSFTFTLDVNKPTWMVTARQQLEEAMG